MEIHFGFSGDSNLFTKIAETIKNAFFILCTTIGTIFLTLGSAYAGSYTLETELNNWRALSGIFNHVTYLCTIPYSALALGTILIIIGSTGVYFDQKIQQNKIKSLDEKITEINTLRKELNISQEELQTQKNLMSQMHINTVETWLKEAANHLKLTTYERISLYYEFKGEFYLLARYSQNPDYNAVHRQKFPKNQGVISKAWQHEKHIESKCPEAHEQSYATYLKETYGYEESKVKELTMKSCRYFGKAVNDAHTHIGVIIFESTKKDFISTTDDTNKLEQYCNNNQAQISKFVRESLKLDREINIKESTTTSVKADELEMMRKAKK